MFEPQVTILHVDDKEVNRYVVARILQDAGFNVMEAATGTAALAAIAEHQPALVILDVKLPDMSGFEVCRQIKANPETVFIPVLHLSATFVQSQDKAEGLDGGADAYLAQPVEPIELIATVRSLLRIRRAEEAALSSARDWQITFDAMNDAVCLIDQHGKFLRCNRAMSRLFHKPTEELLGYAYHEFLHKELGVGDGACFRLVQQTHQRQVLELQAHDQWFAKTIDPVLDEQGNCTGAVFILADITDRKRVETERQQAEIQLQQQADQLRQANQIKDEFLAVLSHELRSPLNPILGWTRILQTRQQDAAKTKYALETIERNAKLQAQLIEDLLDVSRILQGKLSLHTDSVSLPATIKAALETVRLAAEAKTIQIQTSFEPDIGQVLGDSNRLQQVVWNLLANAIKFTPAGGRVEVRLESYQESQEFSIFSPQSENATQNSKLPTQNFQNYAQLTITDTGKGITPHFLPYVFDYFRQADSSTTRTFGGLGLGLAIVRHLVELHGGRVQATSPGDGQGATFTVRLPLLTNSTLSQADSAAHNGSVFNFDGLQVLFVDDDRDSREFITFLLEQQGAKVTEVESASEALNSLEQTQFDLLISDIGMPTMDGYALMRQIRARSLEQGKNIPAIALTAYARDTDHQQALAAGFQHHVTKPIEPDLLMQTISTLVERNDKA